MPGATDQECDVSILLPGIPNDFAILKILTKLSWRTLYRASLLSSEWKNTITRGDVYKAKLLTGRTQSYLLVVGEDCTNLTKFAYIFDPGEEVWTLVPPIPNLHGGFPDNAQTCVLGGKLLVLGGYSESFLDKEQHKTVFMLDIGACHTSWSRCADMLSSREEFACHSINEKIILCGGTTDSQMYHLERNVWEPVAEMLECFFWPVILDIGGNLYIVKGIRGSFEDHQIQDVLEADYVQLYNPREDKWRTETNFLRENGENSPQLFFVHHGRLHRMCQMSVEVLDSKPNWKVLQYNSWSHIMEQELDGPPEDRWDIYHSSFFNSVIALDGKLFSFLSNRAETNLKLFRGDGFGKDQPVKIEWTNLHCPWDFSGVYINQVKILEIKL